MVRKTRKHHSRKGKKQKGIFSIPELRRSFEHIEEYVDSRIAAREAKAQIVKDLRKEWSRVFLKELDKASAEAFVNNRMNHVHKQSTRRRTARHSGGAATPLAGAPNDYTTRQGMYLAPGQIPDAKGHLPLSDGSPSKFGSFVQYVDKGFGVSVPEIAQNSDPVQGQTRFPTSPPMGMGDNTVHFKASGGKRGKTRKTRRGGALGISRNPPDIISDLHRMWKGQEVGPSPSQYQRPPTYSQQ
jgi:hypothetical protein